MKVRLAYGKHGLEIDVPDRNLVKVLAMEGARPLEDPVGTLRRMLKEPIGGEPLAELAARADTACVVICDITRPVPNALLLPPVLETLKRSGIGREAVTILVATGLHRPSTHEERQLMVGEEIARTYEIVDHHARVHAEQRYLGLTGEGTPVYIDERYCRADLKITIGFIEPHLMAGFSGGRKMVAPGCAGQETIKALHSPFFLENPECREGSIEANPLHRELIEIAQMAGQDFVVDVSLDEGKNITGLFAGDPLRAHAAGVTFVRNAVRATLPEPVDIVITTSAGFPLDLTFYQAVKGATAALPVVKEGGTLILAAECAEGLGSPEFSRMATRFSSAEEFRSWILQNPVVVDQWQLEECAKAALKAEVVLVSGGVSPDDRQKLFVGASPTVDAALRGAFSRHGSDATVAVIPKGPYTLVDVDGAG